MSRIALTVLLLALFGPLFNACSSNDAPPSVSTPKSGVASVALRGLGTLDSTRETYVLWLHNGSGWQHAALTNGVVSQYGDSTVFHFSVSGALFDSALLSIEPLVIPSLPTSVIVASKLGAGRNDLASDNVLPVLADASAIATFTTRSADTTRAKHEFYLMQASNGSAEASIKDLPAPPNGWRYGLWVINAQFVPQQDFFFGAFTSPEGASSGGFAGEFEFPGGYYAGQFASAAAQVVVTLESIANLSSRPHVPSPLWIMSGALHQFTSVGDTVALQNAWSEPSVTLTIN